MIRNALVLAIFSLAACGKDSPPPPAPPPSPDVADMTPAPPKTPETPDTDPPKTPPKEEGPADERDVSKSPEAYAQFVGFMKTIGKAKKALGKDIEAKKPEDALKAHLKVILEAGAGAAKVKYLKDDDKNEELDEYFGVFDFKIKRFIGEDWDEDKAAGNLERLGGTCRTCHELWRE